MSKWIEVNIGVANRETDRERILVELVGPFVEKWRREILAWHFLWETKPWPESRGLGVTLRLRVFAESAEVEAIRREIGIVLAEAETSGRVLGHSFGAHGVIDEEYLGESEEWGTRGWQLGVSALQMGTETALELIQNGFRLGRTEEFKKDIGYYADRWTHLFLNQIGTLLERAGIDEAQFDLREALSRLRPLKNLEAPAVAFIDELDRMIGGRNLSLDRPVDFSQGLVDAACRFQTSFPFVAHEDPNIRLMAAISALCASWVGCLAKSKVLAPSTEHPGLSDEDRKRTLAAIPDIATYIVLFFRLGLDLAAPPRTSRGQDSVAIE